MARKMLERAVTFTIIKGAIIENVDGNLTLTETEEIKVLGSVSKERANKMLREANGESATVTSTVTETKRYAMPVTQFIELAEEVNEANEEESETVEN